MYDHLGEYLVTLIFYTQVQKLAITVELLLGDIPDRAIFRQPSMRKTLAPYFQLTQGICNEHLWILKPVESVKYF